MLPDFLANSQNTFISGITLILGVVLLRFYAFLKAKKPKSSNMLDEFRRQTRQFGAGVGGFGTTSAQIIKEQKTNRDADTLSEKISHAESLANHRREADHFDVELITLSRQIKAEIDTKIVALQLMIADADRVLQGLGGHVSQSDKNSTAKYHEPDRIRIIKQEETEVGVPARDLTAATSPTANTASQNASQVGTIDDLAHLNNIVIEDPFVENDFGFNRAMRELDELSAKIPAFSPPAEMTQSTANLTQQSLTQQPGDHSSALPPLSDWGAPISYPISAYGELSGESADEIPERTGNIETQGNTYSPSHKPPHQTNVSPIANDLPMTNRFPTTDERLTETVVAKSSARKRSYTNKILSQPPPQLDSLMTNDTVRKMGSKPLRTVRDGDVANAAAFDEPLVPPMIPKTPPPSAQTILSESAPFSPPENDFDKIAVRKAKRHQLHYLISKGMSPKDIAAHLEMPVGEVELILSLHKRLSGEAGKAARQALANDKPADSAGTHEPISPVTPKGIIPAEYVVIQTDDIETASKLRQFNVIRAENDEEFDDENNENELDGETNSGADDGSDGNINDKNITQNGDESGDENGDHPNGEQVA